MRIFFFLTLLSSLAYGSAYISAKDQQYYKNDPTDGLNKRERIDSLVIEVNKLHGEINSMKAELATLKKDVEELKAKK